MENISPTVIWAVFGLLLIVTEMFTATFFLLFFGLAALLVAGARLIGLDHFNTELLIFSILGVASILIFRKKLVSGLQPADSSKTDENEILILSETVPAGLEGKIEYQGSQWTACNDTDRDMAKGSKVAIAKTQGAKLILKHLN